MSLFIDVSFVNGTLWLPLFLTFSLVQSFSALVISPQRKVIAVGWEEGGTLRLPFAT